MRARTTLPAVVAAALLTVTGCGSDGNPAATSDTGTVTATPAGTSAAGSGPAASPSVPDVLRFTGTTIDGASFDAATLAGKPTVLWFWAPWCPKCRAQAAETATVAAATAGRANVVGVAGLDKNAAMRDFVSDTDTAAFPHLSDEKGEIWKRFKITEQSTYVILDKDGKTTYTGVLPGGKGLADKLAALTG
ncbi:redoxin domain-containing protein [Streptomyces sp. TN58]|uniref:redoxin domain-containing protein n=1 Tax=Streptomyces sp. TN58 TaxID=234612 RepID=UPI0009508A61|nr:redoxin domain-containing protein [Streptomyces sp. TN58]APU43341.1 hypothetical protein BSL84_29820 [Streptomyces sp. TN58]